MIVSGSNCVINLEKLTVFNCFQTIQAGDKILGGLVEDEHFKILPVLMEVRQTTTQTVTMTLNFTSVNYMERDGCQN